MDDIHLLASDVLFLELLHLEETNRASLKDRNSFHRISLEHTNVTIMTIFTSPSWVPPLALDPPDSISINEFMLNETYGRYRLNQSKSPFTCGLTGKTYSALEVKSRVEALAKTLSYQLGWNPREGSEWDKVVAIFSQNTVTLYIAF